MNQEDALVGRNINENAKIKEIDNIEDKDLSWESGQKTEKKIKKRRNHNRCG